LELPEPSRQGRLAVACIDNAEEVRFAVADAATDLAASGLSVAVIDLTQQGNLAAGVRPSTPGSSAPPIVLRPGGIPELASAADLRAVEREDAIAPSIEGADVVLVFADVEPSIGAEYLTAWTDRVILMVTSGRSSTERLRTAVDLSRAVGLDLRFAALLRTERADDSLGGTLTHADKAPVGEQEWAEAVADEEEWAEALAEEEGPVDALATDEQEWAEPIVDEEWAEALADEEWAEALADDEQNQEASAADEQEPAEALTEEAETPEALTEEAETPEALTEEAETPEALTEEAETPEALTEEPETPEALDTDDEVTGADRQPDTETIVEEARGEEQPPDHAEAQPVESEQGAPPEDQPAEHEEAPATELVAEADPTAGLPNQGEAVNGWFSDTAEEPLAHVGSVPSPDSGEFDWSWDWSLDDADTTEQQAVEARHDESDENSQADVEPAPTSNGSEPHWNHTGSIEESDSAQQAMDAWRLYIDEYPLVHVGAAPADEDPHGQSHQHHRAGNGQASNGVRRQRSRSRSRRKKSGHK
jgi:hypothetical protein